MLVFFILSSSSSLPAPLPSYPPCPYLLPLPTFFISGVRVTGQGSVISAGVQTTWTLCECALVLMRVVCTRMLMCVRKPKHFSSMLFPAMSICHRILWAECQSPCEWEPEVHLPLQEVFTGLTRALINTHADKRSSRHVLSLPEFHVNTRMGSVFIRFVLRVCECEWVPLVSPAKRAKQPPHYQPLRWVLCAVVAQSLTRASSLCWTAGDCGPTSLITEICSDGGCRCTWLRCVLSGAADSNDNTLWIHHFISLNLIENNFN